MGARAVFSLESTGLSMRTRLQLGPITFQCQLWSAFEIEQKLAQVGLHLTTTCSIRHREGIDQGSEFILRFFMSISEFVSIPLSVVDGLVQKCR